MITMGIFFSCPTCLHRNRPSKKAVESLKLWILDDLPACKNCGGMLRKDDFFCPLGPNSKIFKRAQLEVSRHL